MDVIRIDGIRALGRHGANPGEREAPQPFDITAVVELDLQPAERNDDLKDTFDYDVARTAITQIVASTSFRLIERLAGEILHAIFKDARVARAEITVAKPEILEGATPSVTLRRDNPNFRAAWPERE
ncbi:MAG TPA: dihydroneopterin aldolase [Candidatus Rubrimentiphilum sp.]|nr:dihydroneopterin aldolase [Candidatus Rubrimentiphilum sp.]